MKRYAVKDRMIRSIAMRKGEVVLRSDLDGLGSQSQVSRALRELVDSGKIVRLGYGVYAKAEPGPISGKPMPRVTLAELAIEALRKLGVEPKLGRAQAEYASGKTTQIPIRPTFNTGQKRISRKISIGKRFVEYENDYKISI